MRTLVIGGTGHIGNYLVEMLLNDGHEVTVMSSGRTAMRDPKVAERTDMVTMRYADALSDGSFAAMLKDKRIQAVVDILQGAIRSVYAQCRESGADRLVACGSVWMFGRAKTVPTPEESQTECPFEGYRQRYAEMREIMEQAKRDRYSASAVMPPNICGPGKIPLDGMGGRSVEVHQAHRRGESVVLPYPGTNLVGPCDAEDVARGFLCALKNPEAAAGEIFNVGSAYALTAERFVRVYGEIYGSEIPIEYVSTEKYETEISPSVGANFHFTAHMCPDISKIRRLLGYEPRYTPEQTMSRAVEWMLREGIL